jgi:hypothetical protein
MWQPSKRQSWTAFALLAAWLGVIWASGLGYSIFGLQWNFSNTGAFGDSFGPLSAAMASVAALSAIGAYRSQQLELQRQQQRQTEDDQRSRRSEFEGTFFRLLEAFRSIVVDTDVHKGGALSKEGRDAFRAILSRFQNDVARTTSHQNAWNMVSAYYRNDLNHYFRFLYHIVKFVDQSEGVDPYFYIQLLRALLSEAELVLLGLNCAYGEGAEKFKPLIEKYALLHSVSQKAKGEWGFDKLFAASAFERQRPEGSIAVKNHR